MRARESPSALFAVRPLRLCSTAVPPLDARLLLLLLLPLLLPLLLLSLRRASPALRKWATRRSALNVRERRFPAPATIQRLLRRTKGHLARPGKGGETGLTRGAQCGHADDVGVRAHPQLGGAHLELVLPSWRGGGCE